LEIVIKEPEVDIVEKIKTTRSKNENVISFPHVLQMVASWTIYIRVCSFPYHLSAVPCCFLMYT